MLSKVRTKLSAAGQIIREHNSSITPSVRARLNAATTPQEFVHTIYSAMPRAAKRQLMREVFGSHNKQQHRWFHSSLQIANSENPNTTAPSAADVDYYINEMNLSLRNGKPEEALEKFKVIPSEAIKSDPRVQETMKVAIDKIHGLGIASPSSSSSSSANDNASGSSGGYGANANNNNNDSNNNTADATWTNPSTGEVHPIHINNNVTLSKGIDKVSLFFNILFLVIAAFWIYSIMKAGSGGGVGSFFQSKFTPVENVNISFDDVIGNAEAKEELRDIVDFLKNPTPYRDQEIKVPKGVLLTGPPGTGKTLLARAMAGEAGVPFISTSGSEFEEMLVGVGARRVRSLFELARQKAPCIIFIDEIDAVGGKRDDSFNRASKQSLNQLLVEMDGFTPSDNVIVIAATNLENTLDPALIRPGRFDRKVVIALPDKNDRKGILDYYLTKKKSSSDVDTEVLARSTPGFSGADLETMVNWAAIEAAKRKAQTISMRLLEESLLSVAMGRERKSLILNDETKQLCAFHEAGHALVALHTDGAHLIRKATLVPRGGALGMVNFLPNDSPLVTQKELLARMDTAMGGRVAEELIYGTNNITQGASSDFSQATSIAKNMVMGLGMSKAVGPFKLDEKRISDHMQHVVELEVQKILNESYARAQRVLSTHKDELHTLANALLKYETLSLEEIQRVLKGEELHYKAAEKAQELEAQRKIEEERIASARKRAEVKTELLRKAGQGEGVSPEKLPEGVKPAIMDGSSKSK